MRDDDQSLKALYQRCSLASVFAALSFSANFAFAYVDATAILVFLSWALLRRRGKWFALATACLLPAILVTTITCGYTLLNWPKGQLYYGATSVQEMWHSLVSSILYELNPQVVNPLILPFLEAIGKVLPWIFYGCSIFLLWNVFATSVSVSEPDIRWRRSVACYLVCVLLLSFAAYWLAHRIFGILLPKERTASSFVPISTLLLGVAAGFRGKSRYGWAPQVIGIATLIIASVYFLGCLRLSYFKEWKFDAETKEAFGALAAVSRQYGIKEVVTEWEYTSAMKFYERYYSLNPTLQYLQMPGRPPRADKQAYVLRDEYDHEFIEQQKLKVVYHGEISDVVVAIRPPGSLITE